MICSDMTDLSGSSSSPTLRSRGMKNNAMLLIRGYSESTRKQIRDDPMGFSRKLLYYMWFCIVLLSVLSLLGYNVNPFTSNVSTVVETRVEVSSDAVSARTMT